MKIIVASLLVIASPLSAMHCALRVAFAPRITGQALPKRHYSSVKSENYTAQLKTCKNRLLALESWQKERLQQEEIKLRRSMAACHSKLCLVKGCRKTYDECVFNCLQYDEEKLDQEMREGELIEGLKTEIQLLELASKYE